MEEAKQRIGDLQVGRLLGSGGMGDVYEGWDPTLERRVALKTIRSRRRLSEDARARFLREARILSRLDHPGICRIYDFISENETDCLVLEYIEGETLDRLIERSPSPERRLEIALAICDVLRAAHSEGIVHRDLKPNNVMVTPDGQVKVLDFGLARPFEPLAGETWPAVGPEREEPKLTFSSDASTLGTGTVTETPEPQYPDLATAPTEPGSAQPARGANHTDSYSLTQVGSVLGTPMYMSPEQARGEPIHTSSDMYSFGLLLRVLFTGEPPYPSGPSRDEPMDRVRSGRPEPVHGLGSELTRLLNDLVALAPAERPTAVTTLARLKSIQDAPKRRLRRLAAAALVGLFVLAGVKYTVDLRRERTVAVEARQIAEQRRGQAEDLIGFMLGELHSKLTPLGRLEILDEVGAQAMDYFAAVAEEELSEEELVSRSRALYQIGSVRIAQGNLEGAAQPLNESLALALRVVQLAPEDGRRLYEAGQAQFWVGYVHWMQDDLDGALGPFQEYLDISRQLVEMDPANLDWQLELSYAQSNIAAVFERKGQLEEARHGFEATLEVNRRLAEAEPERADWQFELARSHNTLGKVLERLGDWDRALTHYLLEQEIKQRLSQQEPEHARWRFELAISLNYEAMLRLAMGEASPAEARFREALDLLRELGRLDADNAEWARETAATLCKGSDALKRNGRLAGASDWLDEAAGTLRALVIQDPTNLRFQRVLIGCHVRIGRLAMARSDLPRADQALGESLGVLASIPAERRDGRQLRLLEAEAALLEGDLSDLRGDAEGARRGRQQAREKLENLVAGSSDREILEPWLRLLLAEGRLEEAAATLQRLQSFGYRAGPSG